MKAKNTNITLLKSKKARNILRGIIGKDDAYKVKKAIGKIKNQCSSFDFKKSMEVIRSSDLFEKNSVSRDFNKVCPSCLSEVINFTEKEVIDKINFEESKILNLLGLYEKLLITVQEFEFDKALDVCDLIIKELGVSCFLVRVLFFLKRHAGSCDECDDILDRVESLFEVIEIGNVGYLENAIKELSNPRTDYFNICKKIRNNDSKGALSYIAKSFVSTIVIDKDEFIATLNAYYEFSLIDAFLYYLSIDRLGFPFVGRANYLKSDLLGGYDCLRKVKLYKEIYLGDSYDDLDINILRESFLLIEMDDFFNYKMVHGSFYNLDENKEWARVPAVRGMIEKYFESVKSLDDLRYVENESNEICLYRYTSKGCSHLENSTAFLYFIEKNDGDISGKEDSFIKLMSYTRDIGYTCPSHYIQKIRNNAESYELKLVVACLMSIKDKSQVVEHALRKIIQEIAISKFDSKIQGLVEYLYSVSPSVTYHLIQICDETFLSKLFHVTDKPNQAIMDRADMLEWYGNMIKDLAYVERAKNLRIDVQINKQKGTIDDSRIYVDPMRFIQWINDNILSDLTLLLESKGVVNEYLFVSLDWKKVKAGLSVNEQVAALLLKCYSEFCNNKLFGIASYLGRRIRHGTFKGTALTEVKEFSANKKYTKLFEDKEFLECYKSWLTKYEDMLAGLKEEYLHIKSKKKLKGMIHSELTSSTQMAIANHMFVDVVDAYIKNGNNLELPYIITEYCWRFIEEDLANIRKFLMENKSKYAVFSYHCDGKKVININRKYIKELCKELNSVTAEKFRTISSWFNKPSIASPSADLALLFNAVVSEIRGFFPDFNPKISFGDISFNISGGVYFVIYDALYILIYNAAKYGKSDSVLEFDVKPDSGVKLINISITSEVVDEETLIESEKLINIALCSGYEDAHIVEGRSGIKKLRTMANDNYISDVKYRFDGNKITASFNFNLDYQL